MRQFLRKARVGVAVATVVVVGGGFASAVGGTGSTISHTVTYEVVSFRSIALGCTPVGDGPCVFEFGQVRQGHSSTIAGPTLKYATTWTGDEIVVKLDYVTALGLNLLIGAENITTPTATATLPAASGGPACASPSGNPGSPAPSVTLNDADQTLISQIIDCGVDLDGYWVTADTQLTLDATGANVPGEDYTMPQTKTVTYTIQGTL